jgi:hypothetical protein
LHTMTRRARFANRRRVRDGEREAVLGSGVGIGHV